MAEETGSLSSGLPGPSTCVLGVIGTQRVSHSRQMMLRSPLSGRPAHETGALSTYSGHLSHRGLRLGRRKPGVEMQPGVLASLLSWCAHHT